MRRSRSTARALADGPAIAPAPGLIQQPRIRYWLGPADRALVTLGSRVQAGDPLIEQAREPVVAEARLPASLLPPEPGHTFDRRVPLVGKGRRSLRFDAPGRVLYTTPAGVLRVVLERAEPVILHSPVDGSIVDLDGGSIVLRADGVGLPGLVAVGRSTWGTLSLAVEDPGQELSPSAIDVDAGGKIVVAGARIDVEALGRARAMGVRGFVTGGGVSRDVRGFDDSEVRQRAAAEAGAAFGMLVLDGYGKRPIPAAAWTTLQAAEGREVALVRDPPMLVVPADVAPWPSGEVEGGRVRIVAGPNLGREGTMLAAAGRRFAGAGLEAPAAWVRLDAVDVDEPEPTAPVAVPLADLERSV